MDIQQRGRTGQDQPAHKSVQTMREAPRSLCLVHGFRAEAVGGGYQRETLHSREGVQPGRRVCRRGDE